MLELKGITKDYTAADTSVRALDGISLAFRKAEFVAVLGPSGCGKTTMLNIVGGLDGYTDGDLLINGKSTKDFKTQDWDAYRNSCVGFVFQNYNLIPHQTVIGNVELALTLSGISKSERRQRAARALERVGLKEQMNKRPNQLSGGQMQRVAIARAIVNDPEIILADEPTGALDSKTSVQIADLLQEIAKERLVIMVTHNNDLAAQYATRTVNLLDGKVVGDTDPFTPEPATAEPEAIDPLPVDEKAAKKREKEIAKAKKAQLKRTSMSFLTAISLSFNNLRTKKGRTFLTSFAGSIGIIGIALVLAISNGFKMYINQMQSDTLAGFPVTVSQYTVDAASLSTQMGGMGKVDLPEYPSDGKLIAYEPPKMLYHYNAIDENYLEHISKIDASLVNGISYSYGITSHVLAKMETDGQTGYGLVETVSRDMMSSLIGTQAGSWQELAPGSFVQEQYDVIDGKYPTEKNEIALVVDKYNRISTSTLDSLQMSKESIDGKHLSDLKGTQFKVILNDDWYVHKDSESGGGYPRSDFYTDPDSSEYERLYNESEVTLEIVGIMRVKQGTPLSIYNTGIVYTPALSDYLREDGKTSEISVKQNSAKGETHDYLTGYEFSFESKMAATQGLETTEAMLKEAVLQQIGASDIPKNIYIYPKSFETKVKINAHLDSFNNGKDESDKILYMDAASLLSDTMGTMIDIISYALVAFAAVSLVVSSIMIGIITWVSVIERTKEIGVLRSIGARKKDISRVFNAETMLIGLVAGVLGVVISFILTFPVSAIIKALSDGMVATNLAVLSPVAAIALIAVSVVLTLVAGSIPSRMAAKKDPVVALRTE
ncbi:MAG: ATP-binding cassette domain-containing protein [Clostridia bacterium]|nr:ATP-binding cassette domain-containing protein [Clostridia bacterium]